jgi:hypothetical protein
VTVLDDSRPDHETKFVLDNRRGGTILRWLELRCPRDAHHPAYRVSSIYFDTRSWISLGEKANSDFSKSKIRLRWYTALGDGLSDGTVRLEVKRKRGGLRGKLRIPAGVSSAELASGPLQNLKRPEVTTLLRAHGVDAPSPLFPAFQIDYTRARFRHPRTGADLCLDCDIHVPRVNRLMVRRHDPRPLRQAVFEVKGRASGLMDDLTALTGLECRKQSFSKYLACYQLVCDVTP